MTRIALAGGTGSLGLTFLSALTTTANPSQHTIHILTRSPPPSPPPLTHPQVSYNQVSYTSASTLAAFLTSHAITLVISAISIDSPATSAAQQTLIAAASLAPSVTHLIPSEYGFPCSAALLAIAPPWAHWAANAAALAAASSPTSPSPIVPEGTGFRYIRIQTGWFADYFGMPHIPTHLTPFPWAVDAARMVAALPGTGDDRVSMTYTGDLARYVAWLAGNLDRWPNGSADGEGDGNGDGDGSGKDGSGNDGSGGNGSEVFLVGDSVTLRSVISFIETTRDRKFESVVCDSEEKLLGGQVTWFAGQDRPSHAHWFAMFGLMACRGLMDLTGDRDQARRVDTKALGWEMRTVRGLIEEAWMGR